MLWLLRLFPAFRDLESLALMQAEKVESYDAIEAQLEEKRVDCHSLQTDLDNLREAHEELLREKMLLQDRLESATAETERTWGLMKEAISGERYALHTMVNHAVQKTGAGIPFPEAHSLPSQAIPVSQPGGTIGRAARMLPSEAIARNNRSFVERLVAVQEAEHVS